MSQILFTSDSHFGHANIIKYCSRPFAHLTEMHEALIERWNKKVQPGDVVYHIGDFALRIDVPEVEGILRRLNGEKHLILGNHDLKNKGVLRARGFVEQVSYKEIKIGDQKIVMCHYPFLTWNKSHHGSFSLHGHCHGTLPRDMSARRLDVGVDCWNYEPLSYDEIVAEMAKVTWKPIDHHGAD